MQSNTRQLKCMCPLLLGETSWFSESLVNVFLLPCGHFAWFTLLRMILPLYASTYSSMYVHMYVRTYVYLTCFVGDVDLVGIWRPAYWKRAMSTRTSCT